MGTKDNGRNYKYANLKKDKITVIFLYNYFPSLF